MIMNVCNYHGLTLVVCFSPVEKTGMSRRSAYWLQFKETKPMSSVEYAIYPTSRTCFHWERTGPKVHRLPRKGLFPVCLLRTKAGQAPRPHPYRPSAYIESLSGLSLTRTIYQQKRRPRRGVFPVPIKVSSAELDAQKRPFREYDCTGRAQTFAAVRRSAAASVCSHVNSGSSRPKWP